MRRGILFFFFIFINISSHAQEAVNWLDYLNNLKKNFLFKDTIVLGFNSITNSAVPAHLKSANSTDKLLFDSLFIIKNNGGEKYYFSYYLSKDNFSVLTFITLGKYKPTLTLFNYSPLGEILSRLEIKSEFIDGGKADSTYTRFSSDTTFNVNHWNGFESQESGKSILVDSVTTKSYMIKPSGRIIEGKMSTSKNSR